MQQQYNDVELSALEIGMHVLNLSLLYTLLCIETVIAFLLIVSSMWKCAAMVNIVIVAEILKNSGFVVEKSVWIQQIIYYKLEVLATKLCLGKAWFVTVIEIMT